MIKLSEKGVFLASNNEIIAEEHFTGEIKKEEAKKGTIAWSILSSHNTSGNMDKLKIKFDSLASHDITFVGIVQTGFAPIFPDICYHLTHYKPAAADIPVASDNPAHYADAIRYNARTPLQGSLLPLTRLVWA